jgi:bacterioferritin
METRGLSKGILDADEMPGHAKQFADMVIAILRDEQAHRRLFEGFLREYELEGAP